MPKRKHSLNESQISFYEILERFGNDLFINEEKMPPVSSDIFTKIGCMLNMSPKSVYLRIKRLKTKMLENNEEENYQDIEPYVNDDNDDSNDDQEYDDQVTITVEENTRKKFVPFRRYWKNTSGRTRTIKSLVPGWADVLCDLMWTNLKLPCCLSFKKVDLTSNGMTTNGVCGECNFKCHIQSTPDFSHLLVKMKNGNDTNHIKKRKVSGQRRKEIAEQLQNQTAKRYINTLANNVMENGDPEPATIPNAGMIFESHVY